jgi:tetratricopeptide (TPR) repeat protein
MGNLRLILLSFYFLIACLYFSTDAQTAMARNNLAVAWRDCQSSDADKRLSGCTSVINASGFGSPSKLADALDGRCWAYHEKEQFTLAIGDCKASIRIRPNYSYAYNNLGTAYAGLGDYENAIAAFNTAIELKPDFYWSRFNRAKALIAIGNKVNAINDYKYLLNRDPTNQDIKNRLNALIEISVPPPTTAPSPISAPSPPAQSSISSASISIPMQIQGGIYVVPVLINDAITLDFIVDSGAADVSIPADVVMTLMRTGTLRDSDFLGERTYVLADGSEVPSQTFRIRSLKVGNKVLENVNGSVASVKGSLLLGQSFLSQFKSWSVDNARHALLLSE